MAPKAKPQYANRLLQMNPFAEKRYVRVRYPFWVDRDFYVSKTRSARFSRPCSKQPGCVIFKGDSYYKVSKMEKSGGRHIAVEIRDLCPKHYKEIVGDSVIDIPEGE